MEFLICLFIFLILRIIYLNIKTEPVYRDSPANPDYKCVAILIEVIFKIDTDIRYNIEDVVYMYKSLSYTDVMDYIYKHQELYLNELNSIKTHFKNNYNTISDINKIVIHIKKL